MSVSTPFILRPVATALLALAVLIAGMLGYLRLPVASLPQVDFPTIQVMTQFPGANPETIASLVTAPLERQLGQIAGVASLSSQSSFGLSQITLQFNLDRKIDAAAQDVQSAINAAASGLPRDLPFPPTYAKVNPADAPIVTLALTSANVPVRALSDIADTLIRPRLSEIGGVGSVTIQGGIRPAVRIQADLSRLAAYGIGLEDLRAAIVAANVAGSKGAIDGPAQSYTIATNDQISAAEAYRNIVVTYRNNAAVLLRDVAEIVDGLENNRVGGWYNGQAAVILDVQKQPGANVVATADRLNAAIADLRPLLPAGAELTLVQDRTDTIRVSIEEVEFTLVLAGVLVVLVVLFFLRSLRATIVAAVALPLSIIATFGVMYAMGLSLNNLSLMALTIVTGFVVDDAIVMIENIARHRELGKPPLQAALAGAGEIGFTIISLTVSLIAVFIPLLFMSGLVGRMFREFAVTLTVAVLVSAVISLTLTPMMCAKLLRHSPEGGRSRFYRIADWPMRVMAHAYDVTLHWALAARGLVLLVSVGTLALTIWLYIIAPKSFMPPQDTGIVTMVLEGAPDVSFQRMSDLQAQVSDIVRRDPAVSGVVVALGIGPLNATQNMGRLTVTLKSAGERSETARVVADRLSAAANRVPGARVYAQPVQDIQISTRFSRSQYQYVLTASDGALVSQWAQALAAELAREGLVSNIALEDQDGGLRVFIDIDREKAARLGVSVSSVDSTLNSAFGQRQISTIYAQSNQYRVVLEAAPEYQTDPSMLARLYVAGTGGAQVPLESFARVTRQSAPLSIAHQEQFPAATLSFDLPEDVSLGEAVEAIHAAEATIGMPGSVTGAFSADAAEFQTSLRDQPWLILAAVVAIYIVLGVLYESFAHPFTILTTLPSAGVGALLALTFTGQHLTIIALIGIILLMGIVKKNAIMMIDFALEAERHQGMAPEEAILQACRLRFRPIMMTTLAALLGAVPLALASGVGAELRQPLGISIIGGLLLSQLLTLYTTPVIYLAVDKVSRRLRGAPAEAPEGSAG